MINRNVPDMVGQISRILGDSDANIHHMVNDSRGDFAYTLIDVDSKIGDDTLAALQEIEGVLRVRVI